jgi:hypothetical protein
LSRHDCCPINVYFMHLCKEHITERSTPEVPKLFWFNPPLTLNILHAPPPSTILGNQVTNCKKRRIMKVEDSLKIIYFWEIHCQ